MNKLEAQMVIEDTGNYVEEEIEDVIKVYEELMKHKGFEDKRRDSRYIVKFHDIFYYAPEEYTQEIDNLFEGFCEEQAEYVEEDLKEHDIDIDSMLSRYDVGHYRAFKVDIPEITNENAIDLAMDIYDEFNYEGEKYVKDYIYTINTLQDLEDNYMNYWIDYLECNEYIPEKAIKEMKTNYEKDKENK